MRIKYLERKIEFTIRRKIRVLKNLFPKRQDKTIERLAYNLNLTDIQDFFGPKLCYILTTKTRDRKSNMAPIKWITEIDCKPSLVAIPIFREYDAYKNIRRYKSFSISLVRFSYLADFDRLIKIPSGRGITAISRFRATPAFFINGYIVKGLPWIECRLKKIVDINQITSIIVGEIIHISKNQLTNPDKLLHYKNNMYLNSKRLSFIRSNQERE